MIEISFCILVILQNIRIVTKFKFVFIYILWKTIQCRRFLFSVGKIRSQSSDVVDKSGLKESVGRNIKGHPEIKDLRLLLELNICKGSFISAFVVLKQVTNLGCSIIYHQVYVENKRIII